MKLDVELYDEPVEVGKFVSGRVRVVEGGPAGEVRVSLTFHEHTRDFDVAARGAEVPVHVGDVIAGDGYEFQFPLGPDQPPSVASKHGELYWQIEVRSTEPHAHTHVRRRVAVVAAA